MTRRRGLHPEETELWQRVTQSTRPLHGPSALDRPDLDRLLRFDAEMPAKPRQPVVRIAPFVLGGAVTATSARHDLAAPLSERLGSAPLRMDHGKFRQMTRGKLAPEGRIDLHGMTLAEAHPALIRFVSAAHADGKRLVLVITGKGRRGDENGPIPQRPGVLKHQVPHWLTTPPLGAIVLQLTEAHLKHGGTGAYYLFLRRQP